MHILKLKLELNSSWSLKDVDLLVAIRHLVAPHLWHDSLGISGTSLVGWESCTIKGDALAVPRSTHSFPPANNLTDSMG